MNKELKKSIEQAQIKWLQQQLEERDKVIDLMAELLCGIDVMNGLGKDNWNWNKEQIKEYFYKKAEEEQC